MNDFDRLIEDIEEEALNEGPEAIRQLEEVRADFSLASELMFLRRAQKITQEKLSKDSGIPQSEISRIENGAANPTIATLSALGRPLGVEVGFVQRQA